MRIGIISDTHDNVEAVQKAVDVFSNADVAAIVHCGDVIAPPVIPLFDGFEFHLVLGNNDGETTGLRSQIAELSPIGHCHGYFAVIEFEGYRIAALHGEDLTEVEQYAASGTFDLVCHGHHHEKRYDETFDTPILNPGAHFPLVPPVHQTVAILDTTSGDVQFEQIGANNET